MGVRRLYIHIMRETAKSTASNKYRKANKGEKMIKT